MKNKDLAKFAKDQGYKYIFTLVKTVFNTEYFNINDVDYVIKSGRFEAAPWMGGYAKGTIKSQLPDNGIRRTFLRYLYNKNMEGKLK